MLCTTKVVLHKLAIFTVLTDPCFAGKSVANVFNAGRFIVVALFFSFAFLLPELIMFILFKLKLSMYTSWRTGKFMTFYAV